MWSSSFEARLEEPNQSFETLRELEEKATDLRALAIEEANYTDRGIYRFISENVTGDLQQFSFNIAVCMLEQLIEIRVVEVIQRTSAYLGKFDALLQNVELPGSIVEAANNIKARMVPSLTWLKAFKLQVFGDDAVMMQEVLGNDEHGFAQALVLAKFDAGIRSVSTRVRAFSLMQDDLLLALRSLAQGIRERQPDKLATADVWFRALTPEKKIAFVKETFIGFRDRCLTKIEDPLERAKLSTDDALAFSFLQGMSDMSANKDMQSWIDNAANVMTTLLPDVSEQFVVASTAYEAYEAEFRNEDLKSKNAMVDGLVSIANDAADQANFGGELRNALNLVTFLRSKLAVHFRPTAFLANIVSSI